MEILQLVTQINNFEVFNNLGNLCFVSNEMEEVEVWKFSFVKLWIFWILLRLFNNGYIKLQTQVLLDKEESHNSTHVLLESI